MSEHSFAIFETAIGPCAIAWGARGINTVQLPMGGVAQIRIRMQQRYDGIGEAEPPLHVRRTITRITALLAGEPDDLSDVDLDLDGVSAFQRGVYEIARRIPPGRTLGPNLARLGALNATRTCGCGAAGESTSFLATCTSA